MDKDEFEKLLRERWANLNIHATRPSLLYIDYMSLYGQHANGVRYTFNNAYVDVKGAVWIFEDRLYTAVEVEQLIGTHIERVIDSLGNKLCCIDITVRMMFDLKNSIASYALFGMAYCGDENWMRPIAFSPM